MQGRGDKDEWELSDDGSLVLEVAYLFFFFFGHIQLFTQLSSKVGRGLQKDVVLGGISEAAQYTAQTVPGREGERKGAVLAIFCWHLVSQNCNTALKS